MTMTKPTSEQVTFTAAGSGATLRNLVDKVREVVSVKDFGAVGDGTADDTAAINAALASGAKNVHIPAGTYKVLATLVVPANVSIFGDGPGASIIDGSSATFSSLTNGIHIAIAGGGLTALPALSSNPVAGASSLVFASAPAVSRGDVVVIFNPANGSWSNFRTYYHAGEMQRIAGVSGSTATTQGALFHGYIAADVDVYVMSNPTTARFSNFALKGLDSPSNAVFGIQLLHGVDCVFDGVRVTDCSYACIYLKQCYNTSVLNCSLQEDGTTIIGGDYGLLIGNCTSVSVVGGYYYAARHAITTGGDAAVGAVVNRLVTYASLTASANANVGVGALDFHGNCEHCSIVGCMVDGGMLVGGDHISVDSCIMVGKGSDSALVRTREMRGTTMSFTNNYMQTYYQGASGRGAFFDIGGNSDPLNADTVVGGVLSFTNNSMDWNTTLTNGTAWIVVNNRGYTGTDVSVLIDSNSVDSDGLGGTISIRGFTTAGKFASVSVQNNVVRNCGLLNLRHDVSGSFSATDVVVQNNIVTGATSTVAVGNFISAVSDSVTMIGNVIRGCNQYAIAVFGPAAGVTTTVSVLDNVIIDGLKTTTGSSTTNADIIVWRTTNAVCANNFFGSADASRNYGLSFSDVTELMARDNTAWQSVNTSTYTTSITGYLPGATLSGTATYDPPSLNDGDGATTTVTVSGAALGDFVDCLSFSLDLQGITLTGYVSAANTVSVRFQNESGGTLDLGSGTIRVRVRKP